MLSTNNNAHHVIFFLMTVCVGWVNIEQPTKIRTAIIICKPPAMSVDSFLSLMVDIVI